MKTSCCYPGNRRPSRGRGFTLIELLVVVAIIALLIGILMPSLGRARDSAKNMKTRAAMKSLGDGLQMFKGENESEPDVKRTGGFPRSDMRADPQLTDTENELCGAQWLIRYLMGKDLKGYVARRNVPSSLLDTPEKWYDPNESVPRVGPYLAPENIELAAPNKLPLYNPADIEGSTADPNTSWTGQLVAVGAFGRPILYYAADQRYGTNIKANIATYDGTEYKGIYTYKDNARFTGMGFEGVDPSGWTMKAWDFGGGPAKLSYGPSNWEATAEDMYDQVGDHPDSFANYILNKNVFDSTNRKTVVPNRKDSYILISAGKDGILGTKDDVKNFD